MLTGKNKRKLTFLFLSPSPLCMCLAWFLVVTLRCCHVSLSLCRFPSSAIFLCIRVLPIPCIFVTTNEGQVGPLWAKIGPLFKSDRTHLQHLDPRDWSSVAPGMAGRPLAHTTNLTTESHIVREFTFDIERLENTRVCKDSWTRIHIEWMLVPLRLLMDGLLQNHSTCGFQIRIPSDRPTRYKHTPTDMQTWGRPSVRTGRALLCLPNGTELMDMSMSTCKNHVSHRKQKSFMPFLVSSSLFFLSLSIHPPVWNRLFLGFLLVPGGFICHQCSSRVQALGVLIVTDPN